MIKRIDSYDDDRFSNKALLSHCAFLIDGEIPCEVEIIGNNSAVIRGGAEEYYDELIEVFRFYAGHISKFYDGSDKLKKEFAPVKLFSVALSDIQPSQFYVDEEKLGAVKTFISSPEEIIIPLIVRGDRYVSEDGHTRLALAAERGWERVNGFISSGEFDELFGFADEAEKRGVFSPFDLKIIPHGEYEILWNKFCDDYLKSRR